MLPKKKPHADLSRFTGLFFAIGLVIATSMTLFAFNINVKKTPPKAVVFPSVHQPLDEPIELVTFPSPPPPPPAPPIIYEGCQHIIECFSFDTIQEQEITELPFSIVDEVPRFQVDSDLPNDQELLKKRFKENLEKHVKEHFSYPKECADLNIQGRVFVAFLIDTEGFVRVKNVRGPHHLLEEKSREIIEKLPRFIAGKSQGKAVSVSYAYPITFKLN